MKIDIPDKILSSFPPKKILYNEPMSNHTSIGTGGPAAVVFVPDTVLELCFLVNELKSKKYFVMGKGKSVLVSDEGYNGIIIKTSSIKQIDRFGRYITALAGDTLRDISEKAMRNELSGLEWAVSDDGTLGAAICTNTARLGLEFRERVYVVEVITRLGEVITLTGESLNMRSNKSDISQKGYTVLRAMLRFEPGRAASMNKRAALYRKSYETESGKPATGDVFSAPKKIADISNLISYCGLAGRTIGGASVSGINSNYIINNGNAMSADVRSLINTVMETVYEKEHVRLKSNMVMLGNFS